MTELVWDLHDARFMDVAGLHLLFEQPSPQGPPRETTVTNLAPQPLRLLVLATEAIPALELARLLPDRLPDTLLGLLHEQVTAGFMQPGLRVGS